MNMTNLSIYRLINFSLKTFLFGAFLSAIHISLENSLFSYGIEILSSNKWRDRQQYNIII